MREHGVLKQTLRDSERRIIGAAIHDSPQRHSLPWEDDTGKAEERAHDRRHPEGFLPRESLMFLPHDCRNILRIGISSVVYNYRPNREPPGGGRAPPVPGGALAKLPGRSGRLLFAAVGAPRRVPCLGPGLRGGGDPSTHPNSRPRSRETHRRARAVPSGGRRRPPWLIERSASADRVGCQWYGRRRVSGSGPSNQT